MSGSIYQYGRIQFARSSTLYPCGYCKRCDTADYAGNCNGCGAPKKQVQLIDVTTLGSKDKQYVYLEDCGVRPIPLEEE
jgi:hypothetical protein